MGRMTQFYFLILRTAWAKHADWRPRNSRLSRKRFGCTPHETSSRNQNERCNNHACDRPPREPLATHHHDTSNNRYQGVAREQDAAVSVERLASPVQRSHQAPVEIWRKTWCGRRHGLAQQLIDPHFVREQIGRRLVKGLSHRNILSLSAFHGEADVRDADTI